MESIISLFFIGISLSMDAFSIALNFGINKIYKRNLLLFIMFVGIFHFIFPIIGRYFGNIINNILNINNDLFLCIIFILLILQIIFDKNDIKIIYSYIIILLLSFSVSVDSFSVGLCLKAISNYKYLPSIIFSIFSMSFTYIGFIIGRYSSIKYEKYSKYLGIVILMIIATIHFIKYLYV